MLATLLVGTLAVSFAPPQSWSPGFAAPPRIPFVGDVNADGYADLLLVYPPGGAIIDVNLNRDGLKPGGGFQALNPWGNDCQAAAVGEIDGTKGTDMVGLFGGKNLRLAGAFNGRNYVDTPSWVELTSSLTEPVLSVIDGNVLAFSSATGQGFSIALSSKTASPIRLPKGVVWLAEIGDQLAAQDRAGNVFLLSKQGYRKGAALGRVPNGSLSAAAKGIVVMGNTVWTPNGVLKLPQSALPTCPTVAGIGDFDADGDNDIIQYRLGSERHTAHQVLLYRQISPGETDSDRDMLANAEEAILATDSLNPDTDGDGLLDGWEVGSFRDLNFKEMGCNPRRVDLICLLSRFATVKEDRTKAEMARVTKFYGDLNVRNPDGSNGMSIHFIYLPEVSGDDMKRGWPENRARLRPEKWRGIAHWMQVTPGGGGQADQLGDGGTIGEGAMWAVFVHEFGHQLGLDHEGFWPNFLCPTYTSLMNYAYSYGFEDDREKIHYSEGRLKDYVLRETDLDETIPLPYEQVRFLEKGPYRFRLKPNGSTTLIDWNWNGVFGEKHVRADINYSYSTNAGRRDDAGKSHTAPWLVVHQNQAFILFGRHGFKADRSSSPDLSAEKPGRLFVRKLRKPFEWDEPETIEPSGLIGDPVAASFGGKVFVAYQHELGVRIRTYQFISGDIEVSEPTLIAPNREWVPTLGVFQRRLYLFLWKPQTGEVEYRILDDSGKTIRTDLLDVKSTNPVGICEDTIAKQAVIGMAQDQDDKRPFRWQIRRYHSERGKLVPAGMEWVEGEAGGSRGSARITVLFERSKHAGPLGRVYLYGRGMISKESPWACTYVAHQIADKSVRGGWLVKRFYDEWTQSRSAPAAAWFADDIIWAYRWVDGGQGSTDNNLHVGYRASGIESAPMADHNDLAFLTGFGIRNSIANLGVASP